jgi:hypothetical protein
VGSTQYARLFINGVFIEQLSGTRDIQPDSHATVICHSEWHPTDYENSWANNFFYGPIYLAYSGRNEVWTDNDVISLHRDHYQFLIPA